MIASKNFYVRATCRDCKIEREYPATKIKSSGSLPFIAPYVNCMSCNAPLYLDGRTVCYTQLTCPACKRQAEYSQEDLEMRNFVIGDTPLGSDYYVTCKYCREKVNITDQLNN